MNENKSLHFDFLLETERLSPSPLRMRFMIPVVGMLCLLGPLVVWQLDSSAWMGMVAKKQTLEAEIAKLKSSHESVMKNRADEKELSAQLQQLGFYQHSKNPVGQTLASLTNCVSSYIQLTELKIETQMPQPFAPQPRPKTALDLSKLCPTNVMDAVTLHMRGRYYQSGVEPLELNRFLLALQGNAFTSLVTQVNRKVDYRVDASMSPGENSRMDIYAFDINYDCLPRRFQ